MASRTASAVETERNRMFIVVLRRIAGIPLNDERGGWKSTISTTTTRIRRRPVRHYRPAPDHERRQSMAMPDTTIYHNPACGTSRTTLGLIRDAGIEPRVIEYLKDPPDRATLTGLIAKMGVPVREVLRTKADPYNELGLDDPALGDDALIDAMLAHPILLNRAIVVTPLGAPLCRPPDSRLAQIGKASGRGR